MKESALALFPFENDLENNALKRCTNVTDTLLSAMRAYIVTRRGSRLGNMVGCFLPDVLHTLVGLRDLKPLADRLKKDMIIQFPSVNFVDITFMLDRTNETADLVVRITFSTNVTEITQLEMILPTGIRK